MCTKTKYADAICKTCRRRLTKPDKVKECEGKLLGKKCTETGTSYKAAYHSCPNAK